jgi:hypothetical protein
LLAQIRDREDAVEPKIHFEIGDKVKVADGPFQNQNGLVEEIDPERGKLRVCVSIFGRDTSWISNTGRWKKSKPSAQKFPIRREAKRAGTIGRTTSGQNLARGRRGRSRSSPA